jgi:hypothetical protein
MNIDIIRTSASRPDLLKISTQSILDHLKFSGKINWFLHEDVLNDAASEECIKYSESLGIYTKIGKNNPPLGHSESFYWLIDRITSDFFMFWEDDYELLQVFECLNPDCRKKTTNKYKVKTGRGLEICELCGSEFIESPTDLDVLIGLMEKYPQINEIVLPKRDILPDKPNFIKKVVKFDDTILTVCHHWYVAPAIWRVSYIMPFIKKMAQDFHPQGGFGWHWEINRNVKGRDIIVDAEWVERHTGTYYLGEIRSGQRILHLGAGNKSLRNGEYKW